MCDDSIQKATPFTISRQTQPHPNTTKPAFALLRLRTGSAPCIVYISMDFFAAAAVGCVAIPERLLQMQLYPCAAHSLGLFCRFVVFTSDLRIYKYGIYMQVQPIYPSISASTALTDTQVHQVIGHFQVKRFPLFCVSAAPRACVGGGGGGGGERGCPCILCISVLYART